MLHLACYIELFYINVILKRNKNHNTLTLLFEKFKTVSFAPSIVKNIVEPSALSRFPVKLIFYMLLEQHLVFAIYLNLLQLICSIFWNRDNLINIITLTCRNLSNVPYVLKSFFSGWSKKFLPSITISWKIILLRLYQPLSSSNAKTKSLFTPWKLGSIR